jgi:23S rRNA (guanine745-N1)-methyltransferase
MKYVQPLICPVCGSGLVRVGQTLKCPQAHSFDISRQGYVNLLLSHRQRSKILGDTKAMLRARRNFLEQGYYAPLSEVINKQVYAHLDGLSDGVEACSVCIADIGCGEGYYLGQLKRYLDRQLPDGHIRYFGLDIAKEAVKLAARRYQEIDFAVVDVKKKIHFAPHSIQILLNIFAPRNVLEFDRIIVPGGMLLVVIPKSDHLLNLRTNLNLLGIEINKQQRVVARLTRTFKLADKCAVAYELHLNGEELRHLIQMSPSYWHFSEENWDRLKGVKRIQTKASFVVLGFCR